LRRKYINKVEVWQKSSVSDGFGGNTQSESKLSDSWAKIKTVPTDKITSYGLDTENKTVIINLRHRGDLDYNQEGIFFKYKGLTFIPLRIEQKDMQEEEFEIIANESY
jgi:head-tail adaptor